MQRQLGVRRLWHGAVFTVLLAGALASPQVRAQAGSWDETGRLFKARGYHTATLLPSGQVLVVGGTDGIVSRASAELYDPATGSWTWMPNSLGKARADHTATLLQSGKVLVVGGRDRREDELRVKALASAELYDPATGEWDSVPDLEYARWDHTATLLPSGQVLVVGGKQGVGVSDVLKSAELYDPDKKSWIKVEPLEEARQNHTATLLPSGQVLFVGGSGDFTNPDPLASVELYDPATDEWDSDSIPDLKVARWGHTATLLPSGQVLVTLGKGHSGRLLSAELYDPATGSCLVQDQVVDGRYDHTATLLPSGKVLVAGGFRNGRGVALAELYDPDADSWPEAPELHEGRESHTATLLPSGKVLVVGGVGVGIQDRLASAELYDPAAGSWTPAPDLTDARWGHTATLLRSGKVLVVGGNNSGALKSVELYDPVSNSWTAMPPPPLKEARWNHTATLLPSGQVLVVGGEGDSDVLSSVELYDPVSNSWTEMPPPPLLEARWGHTATLLPSGKVLVVGGHDSQHPLNNGFLASAELYDPANDRWTEMPPLWDPRREHTATLLPSGQVLVLGGRNSFGVPGAPELYDPATGSWTRVQTLLDARLDHTATLLPSGKVLAAAGNNRAGDLRSAELYDPATGSWTPVPGSLQSPRRDSTATLLPSGKVLVVGGSGDDHSHETAELYDPATGKWTLVQALRDGRRDHTATLLPSGQVLVAGGRGQGSPVSTELYEPGFGTRSRPAVTELPSTIDYLSPFEISGTGLGGDSEASDGGTRNSAVNYPLVQLRALEGGAQGWLPLDPPLPDFCDPPLGFCSDQEATLTISGMPPIFHPGPHLLTVFTAGVPSHAQLIEVTCSLSASDPYDQMVEIGDQATFGPIETLGGRLFRWQQCVGDPTTTCAPSGAGWMDIPGATAPSYTTPLITGPESGTLYRVIVGSGCTNKTSETAVLAVMDTTSPDVAVVTPNGGELWQLSTGETVSWAMSDNIRICKIEADLLFSNDGGSSFQSVSQLDPPHPDWPQVFGPGGTCHHPGEATTSSDYTLPDEPPSGQPGSLYRVRVTVTDHAGKESFDESDHPFFIVEPNNQSIKTLILWHPDRMDFDSVTEEGLGNALINLAAHPKVRGRIVDLSFLDLDDLYGAWDNAANREVAAEAANDVLFGPGGIHAKLGELLTVFTGVEYLVLVGDDRVIPLARIDDRTATAPENVYPDPDLGNGDLTRDGTTVGEALAANRYLSDDPLASKAGLTPTRLEDGPDLAVGRLVETPADIIASIATFISHEGILDLTGETNKVLVSAYDFLVDSGTKIFNRWQARFPEEGVVDGAQIGQSWNWDADLLCPAEPFGVLNLNGHATHYQVGHPIGGPFDIFGLDTSHLTDCDLTGSVVYAVGCHSGLPVAGSTDSDDHPQDLPQTMLGAGAMVYLANTGYGWGLRHGSGYSERLVEIFTDELNAGDTVIVGKAVQRTKLRYSLSASRFDVYDEKVSKQWTLYGFPMYELKTRSSESTQAGDSRRLFQGPPPRLEDLPWRESFGPVTVERLALGKTLTEGVDVSPPSFLVRLGLHFDFIAEGVYKKFNAAGLEVPAEASADYCDATEADPDPTDDVPQGCYYALNKLSSGQDLATGTTDRPLQPMFIYDSRLSDTAFHGFLWMGGAYVEERDWIPLIAELQSNIEPMKSFDASSLPSTAKSNGRGLVRSDGTGSLDGICPASDLAVSSLVLEAGEVLRETDDSPAPDVQRRYETVDVETLHFNNSGDPGANCDVSGPTVSRVEHRAVGTTVDWEVEASDPAGVWRVVVVWNDGAVDASGRGRWRPLELELDAGAGTWKGAAQAPGATRLAYFVQAVDNRGNVTVPVASGVEPPSGVPLGLPEIVTIDLTGFDADLAAAVSAAPNPVQGLTTLSYSLQVTNLGPDAAANATAVAHLPPGLTDVVAVGSGWSCAVEPAAVECTRGVAERGPAPLISIFAMAPPTGGVATLTAALSSTTHDPNPGNDSASASVTVVPAPRTDLVLIQEVGFGADGRSPAFAFRIVNTGSLWAHGARVFDFFDAALSDVVWTCERSLGSSCSASGVGIVDEAVTLPPKGWVEYLVSTTLAPGFGGLLTNTATVTPPAGFYDPDMTSNSDTVTIDYSAVFADSFESGGVAAWTRAVGETP